MSEEHKPAGPEGEPPRAEEVEDLRRRLDEVEAESKRRHAEGPYLASRATEAEMERQREEAWRELGERTENGVRFVRKPLPGPEDLQKLAEEFKAEVARNGNVRSSTAGLRDAFTEVPAWQVTPGNVGRLMDEVEKWRERAASLEHELALERGATRDVPGREKNDWVREKLGEALGLESDGWRGRSLVSLAEEAVRLLESRGEAVERAHVDLEEAEGLIAEACGRLGVALGGSNSPSLMKHVADAEGRLASFQQRCVSLGAEVNALRQGMPARTEYLELERHKAREVLTQALFGTEAQGATLGHLAGQAAEVIRAKGRQLEEATEYNEQREAWWIDGLHTALGPAAVGCDFAEELLERADEVLTDFREREAKRRPSMPPGAYVVHPKGHPPCLFEDEADARAALEERGEGHELVYYYMTEEGMGLGRVDVARQSPLDKILEDIVTASRMAVAADPPECRDAHLDIAHELSRIAARLMRAMKEPS